MNYGKPTEENQSDNEILKTRLRISEAIKSYKFPLLITFAFLIVTSYVAFFLHNYWFEYDGIFYLHSGEEILKGNGKSVGLVGASIGGPLIFASLNSLIHDGFFTEKLVSVLCGTGIVFFSFFVIKNIFGPKVALVAQLFVALNPQLDFLSILALNELPFLLLITIAIFFITKRNLNKMDIAVTGGILGGAFVIRYQSLLILLAVSIFLLIRNKEYRTNVFHVFLMCALFLAVASPMFVYNYLTYEKLIDMWPTIYIADLWHYQDSQWHNKISSNMSESISSVIFENFNLFLKNYLYNLFYYNSSTLFNFFKLSNLSIIPPIPFLGIMPFIGGLLYSLKIHLSKRISILLLLSITTVAAFIFFVGNFHIHSFAILIIPIIFLSLLSIRKIKKNFLPLLIISTVFFMGISIYPAYRPYQLFPVWFSIVVSSAVFFIDVVPEALFRINKSLRITILSFDKYRAISLMLVSLVLLVNLGFSYKLVEATLYNEPYAGISAEFSKLLNHTSLSPSHVEDEKIIKILSQQSDIKNSYVMAGRADFAYYLNSKFVYTDFTEGIKNEDLNKWIARENWSPSDLYFSNLNSYPPDRNNLLKPIPSYLIYEKYSQDPNTPWYYAHDKVDILSDPNNPEIPSNFKVIYHSNKTNTVVYKIYPIK